MSTDKKFNFIYTLYGKLIYLISYSILKDEELTKDAVQECCIRIYRNLDCFGETESLSARSLVSIIARNAAIDLLRKVKKQEQREIQLFDELPSFDENEIDQWMREMDLDGLEQYASKLEDQYASVLILRYYYELPYKKIGNILNITESNAKVRMNRAKRKLANLIRTGGIDHE